MAPKIQSRCFKFLLMSSLAIATGMATAADKPANGSADNSSGKPNILVFMGDDVGIPNISVYGHGMMGYQTPNIDRIAKEGVMFTDYYGEQSCTAGRAAFITGQSVIRTGLTKVGMPGASVGIQPEDPTMGELLRAQGYATGQFGKNHLGDLDEYLPTNHGFDEFFGNLYHLNAEEEPENEDYPKDPPMKGPRGVIKAAADGSVEDTGALTKKRMETVDDEFAAAALDFIDRNTKQKKPWFVWMNSTRMHFFTHVREANRGKSGLNEYADGMLELAAQVGLFLDKLEKLGIEDNTIVLFTTDNGVHESTWPDAGVTPFRNEKTTSWEGAFRVPAMVRWPGKIKPGVISNDMMSHMDWLPTFLAAAGDSNIIEECKKGCKSGDKTFKVHMDGYNFLPMLTGEEEKGPRHNFIYATDDGQVSAVRFADRWKAMYLVQDYDGMEVWARQLDELKAPLLFDLRMDPYEKAYGSSNTYWDFWAHRGYMFQWATTIVADFAKTFDEYPQRQTPASWNVSEIMKEHVHGKAGKTE